MNSIHFSEIFNNVWEDNRSTSNVAAYYLDHVRPFTRPLLTVISTEDYFLPIIILGGYLKASSSSSGDDDKADNIKNL